MSILNACKCRGKKNSFTNDFESSSIQLINDWFWPYGWKKGCWIKHQSNIPAHAAKSGGFVEWREIETKNRRSYFMMFIIYRPRWRFRLVIDAHFHRNNIATTDDYILIEMLPLFLSRMILLFGCIVFTMHVHIILPFNEVSVDFCAISVFIRNLARMPSNKEISTLWRSFARLFLCVCRCFALVLPHSPQTHSI